MAAAQSSTTEDGSIVSTWPAQSGGDRTLVSHEPVMDVARGTVAGYRTVVPPGDRSATADLVVAALAALPILPTNTFLSVPLSPELLDHPDVLAALRAHATLAPVLLDLAEPVPGTEDRIGQQLEEFRAAGALVTLGSADGAQPTLRSVTRLRPAVIRLGRAWVSGLDRSASKRSAIELTGQLASQLDAWILAEDVTTSGELRALAELGVPLAQGPFVGAARETWSNVDPAAQHVVPTSTAPVDGALRELVQQTYTTTDLAAASAVLPEATGFEVVVVVDERGRPVSVLERDATGRWEATEPLVVNVDTSVPDVVERSLARPRVTRFSPVAVIDAGGRLLGILRIERLMAHLVESAQH